VALRTASALCMDDRETLSQVLTRDSFNLYKGLVRFVPDVVRCDSPDFTLESVRPNDEQGNTYVVGVVGETGYRSQVVVARTEGQWKVDLFLMGWQHLLDEQSSGSIFGGAK